MTKPTDYLEIARRYLRGRRDENHREAATGGENQLDRELPTSPQPQAAASIRSTPKGQAVELWSNSSGRLFLVADEEDARLAMERLAARRGEIYTAMEVQRIVVVGDPTVVSEICEWKRRFDGTVQDTSHAKAKS